MSKQWDSLWYNANLMTSEVDSGTILDGAIAVKDGKIAKIFKKDELKGDPKTHATEVNDLESRLLTPGFIDCHTHVVYAGDRAGEWQMRLQGKTYAEIARAGGGIQTTVNATRAASVEELFLQSIKRVLVMLQNGVTTLEIKSGYGLNWETEIKMLRVAQMLADALPITIRKTFLGAHKIPAEFTDKENEYVDLLCNEMLPQVAQEKLADAVDVFCENIAFDIKQTEKIFKTAKLLGLDIKCHAEQLSDSGAASLAAQYNALSVDHLEFLSEAGIAALAKSQTVAVLLPGAYYFLRETKMPPVAALREHNIPIAIASDCNPGTSPILSLLLIMNMACTLFGLTVEEAMLATTLNAARALGINATHGSLKVGKVADMAIWDVKTPAELIYNVGNTPLMKLIKDGQDMSKISSYM